MGKPTWSMFIAVHLLMTMPPVKNALFGRPQSTPFERRVYITVTVVMLVGVYALHRPVPGFGFESPLWLQFLGLCLLQLAVVAFFEYATFPALASLLGVHGAQVSHSVGEETPLLTEGSYEEVRHPMYRAALGIAAASLLVHPNATQLLFAAMVSASFVGFIPFEERQLLRARPEGYATYMRQTPYRLLRGVW